MFARPRRAIVNVPAHRLKQVMLACGFLSPPELSVTLSGCALFASWQNILGLKMKIKIKDED